jgi:hypothetical protein
MLADVAWLAGYHFEAGARTFGTWSGKMIEELGEWIKPSLDRLWSFVSHRVATHEALANVKPATIHVPIDERPPLREASEWSLAIDEANIQSTAPAPKVRLSEENAKKLIYYGQRELAEMAISALTRPSLDRPGFVLAASTGSGKGYMGTAIVAELKPKSVLHLTTNQGLIDKAIAVGKEFGLDIQRLPPTTKGIPPEGHFISTYSAAIGRSELVDHPWNFLLADESGAGRRWWVSKTGALLRNISQKADRTLYMSATPFHTPVELGYADNLGLWKPAEFEHWVSQFGVFQDENGDWVAPANPKRFAKLRLQMTDAGVFVNLTPNLDGYTTSFGVVPLTPEQRGKVGDIKKAFDLAVLYFTNRGRSQMARAAKAGRVVYSKAFLERSRLPEAIEIAKKGRAKGWSVGIFTETRSGSNEIYNFLKEADAATHGQISKLLPPLPDVIETLRTAFGGDFANFSGSYSEMRQGELEAFNKGEKPVLASTYAAGGMGVDMDDKSGVRPRLAIFLGPPWSGVMLDQALGRFWRFGTKSDVFAVFLSSDSRAEFQLVHGKVIPRLASLRALIKGVHSDEFVKSFQNIEAALAYSQGGGEDFDPDDFMVKVQSNSINLHDRIEIPDATTAHNKGLAIPRIDDVKTTEPGFRDKNTVFTKEGAEKHEENLTDHMGELRGGIDPSMITDLLYIGGSYVEGGIREFGRWSTAMTERFGEGVREYLPQIWDAVGKKLAKKKLPKVKAEEPVLLGFEAPVQEQKAAAAAEVGRKLTEKVNEGPMSIDFSAGQMERESPLFRGTEGSPQTELFSAVPAPAPGATTPPPVPSAGLHQTPEVRQSLDEYKNLEAQIQQGHGSADMVLVAAARAKGANIRKEAFRMAMQRAGVTKGTIDNAVRKTWEALHAETLDSELRYPGRHELPAPGPGAQTAGSVEMEGTPVEQLTAAMRAQREVASRVRQPKVEMPDPPEVQGTSETSRVLKEIGGTVADVWKMYSASPPSGSFVDALGRFQGNLQRNTLGLERYVKEMMKQFPNKLRREAITNWVQAEGNEETLRRWASLSKGRTRKGYAEALTLSDAEKLEAANIRNMFDSYWEVAHEAGVLEGFIENYLPQIRKPGSKFTSRVLAEIMGGILRTDFKFAKKRAFETYFEGEQAGYPALNKDIGFLVTTYVKALVKAIEGRALVRNLLETYAKDGKPLATVSGSGRVVGNPLTGQRRHFINPNIRPEEAMDAEGHPYRSISHPALRKWIWAGKDAKGNAIFLQGDIIVHPSIFKHLRNVLSQSAFRRPDAEWYLRAGRMALSGSSFLKQSFLGPFSTFHQAQVALHGVMHRVNPLTLPEIKAADPDQMGLMNGGLLVANPDGAVDFEEGLVAGGIWDMIPGFGRYLRAYKDYLFKDYIPRLKMSMALESLKRNKDRYGKTMSLAQIYRLTGSQGNAAFGEQNYIMMGRNKTLQDCLRLVMLSPDFTESRARFVGQALRPYGREQLTALALGAGLLIVSAYSVSKVLKAAMPDTKVEWNPDEPFQVRVGKYEFDMRSIQGDIQSLLKDWGAFFEARANPATMKPALEAIRGKDWRGMPRTWKEQVHDYFYGLVPITFQGVSQEGRHFWESALGGFGIRVRKFYSPAGKLALQYHLDDIAAKPRRHETPELLKDRQEVSKLLHDVNDGKPIPPGKIDELEKAGSLSRYSAHRLRMAKPGEDPFLNLFAGLGLQDKLDVWDKASDEERVKLRDELTVTPRDRRELRAMPEAEMRKVLDRYHAIKDKAGAIEPPKPTGMLDEFFKTFGGAKPAPTPRASVAPVPQADIGGTAT